MAYPLAALAIKPTGFDPVGVLQTASQLQGQQSQNELASLRMQELQEQMRESRDKRGALEQFRTKGGMANPAALTELNAHPEAYTQALSAMDARQKAFLLQNARAAQRVMAFRDPAERSRAWREELDAARREGRIPEAAYERYAALRDPPADVLQSIIEQARPISDDLSSRELMEMAGMGSPRRPGQTASPPASGGSVVVDASVAPQFEGLMRDLQQSGVRIDPTQTGGFANRNIRGTNMPSLHASGRAVDINWNANPEGALPPTAQGGAPFDPNNLVDAAGDRAGQTQIPTELARALAQKNDLRWGGDFQGRSPDPMHFEARPSAATPVANRSLVTAAGLTPGASPAAATAQPSDAVEPPRGGNLADIMTRRATDTQRIRYALLAAKKDVKGIGELIQEIEGGGMNPRQRAETEEGLRKEFASIAKPYFEVRDAFTRIQSAASAPSAAGDLALIFNFMKMLDPGSVVREGEFATAQNAAGIPDRIRNMWNRALNGERLNEEQRADFLGQARGLMTTQERQYQTIQGQYGQIARRMGLDPQNTILDFSRPSPPAAQAEQLLNEARQAIQSGRDPKAVRDRLQDMGVDPKLLDR